MRTGHSTGHAYPHTGHEKLQLDMPGHATGQSGDHSELQLTVNPFGPFWSLDLPSALATPRCTTPTRGLLSAQNDEEQVEQCSSRAQVCRRLVVVSVSVKTAQSFRAECVLSVACISCAKSVMACTF
jgi:hypothetical protein